MVLLSFPAANRDPEMFPDADKVIIDRKENRHAAFGLGIHRCVGSNLARMEMTVAVEELLKRIPEFSLDGEVKWSEGTVRGPRKLPITVHDLTHRYERAVHARTPSCHRLGHRLGPSRPALGRGSLSDLGRARGRSARSRTPSASRACICRRATRTCATIAYDPEHFSSRRTAVREMHAAQRAAVPRRSPPTRPGTGVARMVLLPPFTPQGHRDADAEDARDLQPS